MFNKNSAVYNYRWLIMAGVVSAALMLWHDSTGRRMFIYNTAQQWTQSGPGFHK